jgi:DNA-binding CsgD family transcriptional regulator
MTHPVRRPWPLVGRDAELATLLTVLGGDTGGVVLAGPPGVGKTSLARWCVEHSSTRGRCPEWVHGTAAAAAIPLGAFAPMLPTVAQVSSPDRLLHEAHRSFHAKQPAGAPLLAVDDAHLLDELSALLVHQLVTSGQVPVILTLRSGATPPAPLLELWKNDHLVRIDVRPLRAGEVEELLSAVLGGPVDLELAHQLWRTSMGNPLYLRELLCSAWEREAIRRRDGTWQLVGELHSSARLKELVEFRLSGLGESAREALELLAVGEPLELVHLGEVVRDEQLADLERAGLVQLEPSSHGGAVRLAHPVYAEVLRGSLPLLKSRRIHRFLADLVGSSAVRTEHDQERVVRWRIATGSRVPVPDLVGAARSGLRRFDVAFARRCAQAAYQELPNAETGLVLAEALMLANEHIEAEGVLATVEQLCTDQEDILRAARIRAGNLFHWLDRPDEARETTIRAEHRLDSPGRRRLTVTRAQFDLVEGNPAAALAVAEQYLGDGDPHSDPHFVLEAAALAGQACLAAGSYTRGLEVVARVAAIGRRMDPVGSDFDSSPHKAVELFILLCSGQLSQVSAVGEAAHREAIESGAAIGRGWFAYLLGAANLLRGRPVTAERWFRDALAAMTRFGADSRARLAVGGLVRAAALSGDGGRAAGLLRDLDRYPGRRQMLLDVEVTQARAWTHAARGAPERGAALLAEAAVVARSGGAHSFEAVLLHDALRLGDRSAAALHRLGELDGVVEGRLMVARAAHARALRAAAPAALRAAAEAFESIGAYLLAAEAAAHGALLAVRKGQDRQSTALGRLSRTLASQGEQACTPPLAAIAGPTPLTGRELDIARLAATGLSSKAIAERLHLSVRTVDNYLGRIFTKLGATRRSELAGLLDTGPVDVE